MDMIERMKTEREERERNTIPFAKDESAARDGWKERE